MEKKQLAKTLPKITPGTELVLGGLKVFIDTVGEKRNYNLQPGVTEYQLWPFSTIEWVAAQSKYRARAIIQQKTTRDLVAFNSWHQDYADAERAIGLVSDSLNGVGERHVYNIFGEIIEVHSADIGGGPPVNVTEVLGLIWSMQQITTP
jgi:hypothetical protein